MTVFHGSSVSEPKRLFLDPAPDPTFQILPDPVPDPATDLALDPFPDPGQNQIFKEHLKKIYTSFRSVENWTAVLFSQTFDVTKCITFGNLYYFHYK